MAWFLKPERRHDHAAIQSAIDDFICYVLGPEQLSSAITGRGATYRGALARHSALHISARKQVAHRNI